MAHSVLERLFAQVVEQARSAIGAHQAVASLTLGPDWSQSIVAISLSDKYADFRSYNEKPQGTGIYTLVCRHNRPMRMTQEEIEAHPSWQNFGPEKGRHPPMRGWLAAPGGRIAHAGINTVLPSVPLVGYGYWSAQTSTPRSRARWIKVTAAALDPQ